MTAITLQATACEFENTETGFRVTRFEMMQIGRLAREDHEITKAAEVQPLADAMRARLEAEHPGQSFFVSHRLGRGERAPAGYRKLPHRLAEVDCHA
jgi:hypothetical protein